MPLVHQRTESVLSRRKELGWFSKTSRGLVLEQTVVQASRDLCFTHPRACHPTPTPIADKDVTPMEG